MLVMTPPKKQERKATGVVPQQEWEPQWVHFQIQDEELFNNLQTMVKDHQGGVSAFMRWLIAQEWMRQGQGAHWVGKGKGEKEEGR